MIFLLPTHAVVSAEENNAVTYFSNIENLSVIENGDEGHKTLYLVGYCNPDDTGDDYNNFYAEIIDRLNEIINSSWFDYEYVMIDFWQEELGRIGSWTLDICDAELVQEEYWHGQELDQIYEEQNQYSETFSYNNLDARYLKHEVTYGEYGDKALVVYYEFTNNSNKNQSFLYSFSGKCFQNGVEMEASWMYDSQETENSVREVKPGTTVTVATPFEIGEDTDNIVLEVTPWLSDEILFEKQLDIE